MLTVKTGVILGATLCATAAVAGGIERNAPSTSILFEDGRYLEFSGRVVAPDLTGTGGSPQPVGNTGNLLETYFSLGFAYKADINDRLSYAVIINEPWGVDTDYPVAAGGYGGTVAELTSYSLSGILAYDATPAFKLYAGARVQSMEATATIPFLGSYSVAASQDYGYGYLVGAAFSKPEIALRIALTYYSEIEHSLNTAESFVGGSLDAKTGITTPQAINLEFQTGIAADTLVFGSIRWVDWSSFAISPPLYTGTVVGSPLVDYAEDWTNYTIGVGRRFNENWSGAIIGSYEPATNTVLTTLGPIDGRTSIGLAVTRTSGNVKFTAGASYVWLGEANNVLGTHFSDGSAIVAGFKIGIAL
ncbi:MAG: OmpP1/FadL family transporter [Paracoccaceae bacterium]